MNYQQLAAAVLKKCRSYVPATLVDESTVNAWAENFCVNHCDVLEDLLRAVTAAANSPAAARADFRFTPAMVSSIARGYRAERRDRAPLQLNPSPASAAVRREALAQIRRILSRANGPLGTDIAGTLEGRR